MQISQEPSGHIFWTDCSVLRFYGRLKDEKMDQGMKDQSKLSTDHELLLPHDKQPLQQWPFPIINVINSPIITIIILYIITATALWVLLG